MLVKGKFGVDAGNISVMDLEYVHENGGEFGDTAERACRIVDLEPGTYEVEISVKRSWRGSVKANGTIVTTGKVVIGDACYCWSSDEETGKVWRAFLDKTNYLKKMEPYGLELSTGGDGEFATTIVFTRRG